MTPAELIAEQQTLLQALAETLDAEASCLGAGKADGEQTSFGTEVMSVAVTRAFARGACFAIEPPSEFPTMPTPLEQSMVGERQSTASGLASPEKSWLARLSMGTQAALWLNQLVSFAASVPFRTRLPWS